MYTVQHYCPVEFVSKSSILVSSIFESAVFNVVFGPGHVPILELRPAVRCWYVCMNVSHAYSHDAKIVTN